MYIIEDSNCSQRTLLFYRHYDCMRKYFLQLIVFEFYLISYSFNKSLYFYIFVYIGAISDNIFLCTAIIGAIFVYSINYDLSYVEI